MCSVKLFSNFLCMWSIILQLEDRFPFDEFVILLESVRLLFCKTSAKILSYSKEYTSYLSLQFALQFLCIFDCCCFFIKYCIIKLGEHSASKFKHYNIIFFFRKQYRTGHLRISSCLKILPVHHKAPGYANEAMEGQAHQNTDQD